MRDKFSPCVSMDNAFLLLWGNTKNKFHTQNSIFSLYPEDLRKLKLHVKFSFRYLLSQHEDRKVCALSH